MYHGQGQRDQFFEGWYYKLVDSSQNHRWAVIPGVFKQTDPSQSHAFIQVLDGLTRQATFHRYPLDSFQASNSSFDFRIGANHFHQEGLALDIQGENQTISGELHFDPIQPWPVTFLSPGAMGWYTFLPFMQTYHGILGLDHRISGDLTINGNQIDFSDGRGYMEKDWGKTFPRAYIWMQSNHFSSLGTSLTASVATIPWLGSWFRGFIVGLFHNDRLYRFTTYLGSELQQLTLTDRQVIWRLHGNARTNRVHPFSSYQLEMIARRSEGGLIAAPEITGMEPRIVESLTANIEVRMSAVRSGEHKEEVLFEGIGECAGLEVAGSVEEIVEEIEA